MADCCILLDPIRCASHSSRRRRRANPPRRMPQPLLSDDYENPPPNAVAAPPTTPPTILAVEAQPIDLTTALQLANVQNPEFNVRGHPDS